MIEKKLLQPFATVAEPRVLETRGVFVRLSVVSVARILGVSRQRAGVLLADGRVEGAKRAAIRGTWWVPTPVRLTKGLRGPQAAYNASAGVQVWGQP